MTSHIRNWALSFFWLHLFILSGVISPLFSGSIWAPTNGEFIFQCAIFLSFHTIYGVLQARILIVLPFPSLVDYILSEFSIMTHPSWVALHSMSRSFTELDKAVVHMIRLVFCDCGFPSVCLLRDKDKRHITVKKRILKAHCYKMWKINIELQCLYNTRVLYIIYIENQKLREIF